MSETKTVQLKAVYTQRQTQAAEGLESPDVRRLLYGGAKGGGKSWFLCIWCFLYAWDVASRLNLQPSKNPPHIGWMGRKQAVDFAGTTMQTWRQTIPEQYYELKASTEKDSKHILIMGRVAIDYGGLDKQEQVNKFNSAEYGFIALDQAEETTRDDVSVIQGSLRKKINGIELPYKELYTANPASCWLIDSFIDSCPAGNMFVPALPKDNPHLPVNYEQTLIDAFGYRPELLAAYKDGNWKGVESSNQVILGKWIDSSMLADSYLGGKIVACDVARFGDDKTVIMVLQGTDILEHYELTNLRTTEASSKCAEYSRRHGNCPIIVDEIGVGAGVVDELYTMGRNIIPFNSSDKADNSEKYYNRRAEAWWELAEMYSKYEVGCKKVYDKLRKELVTPTYDFRNGKILIEAKDDIKQRLGYSPDHADCYIMGVYGLKRAKPSIQLDDRYYQEHEQVNYEPLGVSR